MEERPQLHNLTHPLAWNEPRSATGSKMTRTDLLTGQTDPWPCIHPTKQSILSQHIALNGHGQEKPTQKHCHKWSTSKSNEQPHFARDIAWFIVLSCVFRLLFSFYIFIFLWYLVCAYSSCLCYRNAKWGGASTFLACIFLELSQRTSLSYRCTQDILVWKTSLEEVSVESARILKTNMTHTT